MLRLRPLLVLLAIVILPATAAEQQAPPLPLVSDETLAPGVRYFRFDAKDHLGAGGHISARLIEIDRDGARLDLELGKDGLQGRDTVPAMAARRQAIAAINAGFFGTTGDPSGILKIDGLLVSDTLRPRGAVGFARPEGQPLIFDRVTVRGRLRAGGDTVAISGVDTARGQQGAALYTPRFGATTKTGVPGVEYALSGTPLRVASISHTGNTAIPPGGFVISATGAPPALARLRVGDRVELQFTYAPTLGTPESAWRRADDIVGGAGLLIWRGRDQHDWAAERLDVKGFVDARHPRTLIGRDREGDVWLIVVDGRQPQHSVGMSLAELTAFARRLGMVDALNLDGGGSTTMVVKGTVVNQPSDATGPRPVSDAIVVNPGRSRD